VKWRGFPEEENSWEPLSNLTTVGIQALIAQYDAAHPHPEAVALDGMPEEGSQGEYPRSGAGHGDGDGLQDRAGVEQGVVLERSNRAKSGFAGVYLHDFYQKYRFKSGTIFDTKMYATAEEVQQSPPTPATPASPLLLIRGGHGASRSAQKRAERQPRTGNLPTQQSQHSSSAAAGATPPQEKVPMLNSY
jgi:hypothetical protein